MVKEIGVIGAGQMGSGIAQVFARQGYPVTLFDVAEAQLSIMEVLYSGFKDSKYRPFPLLVKMVEAGRLGRKSGRGFYSYG